MLAREVATRRWIAGSSLRPANYKISPSGPIALPALSGFSTPARGDLRRNNRGRLYPLTPPLRGRAGERGGGEFAGCGLPLSLALPPQGGREQTVRRSGGSIDLPRRRS